MSDDLEQRALRIAQWGRIRWWNACAWYLVTLAEGLARTGHQSFVLAPRTAPLRDEAIARGLEAPDLGDLGSSDPRVLWRSVARVESFLRDQRIDVVNIHSGPGHAALAWICRRLDIAVVRTRGDIRLPRGTPFQRWLYRRGTDHHIASAEFLRRAAYPRLGIDPSEVSVLRGGIDLSEPASIDRAEARRRLRAEADVPADAWVVGMIARLSPVKGHLDLLRAVARLAREWPRLHVVLAGQDAQLSSADLRAKATELGIGERVRLVGRVDEPLRWAAGFDAAVIASTGSEAICRSAFEYLALGLPVVAARINAVEEIVTAEVGLPVPPGDSEAIAVALSRLRDEPGLGAALGEAARRRMEECYRLERFAGDAVGLFRQVLARKRDRNAGAR